MAKSLRPTTAREPEPTSQEIAQEMVRALQSHVQRMWRQSRPKATKRLKQTGQWESETWATAEMWDQEVRDLTSQGMSHQQATNQALRDHVVLPDLGEEDPAQIRDSETR